MKASGSCYRFIIMRFENKLLAGLFPLLLTSHISYGDSAWFKNLPRSKAPRILVHMHSVYSHDACDGKPQSNGKINRRCLKDFRAALCQEHIDTVFLTEHKKNMAYASWVDILNLQSGDTLIEDAGEIVGSQQHCADGHVVQLFPGAENHLMPIGLRRPPELEGSDLYHTYGAKGPEAVEAFRRAGALVAIPHVEEKNLEEILQLQPDLLEVYNPHADLKEVTESRNPFTWIKNIALLLPFAILANLEPDLIFLAFFSENPDVLRKWAALTLERPISAFAGSDSHQNAIKMKTRADHERVDSYRRTMRWFSNLWFDRDSSAIPTRAEYMAALSEGRTAIVFEALGTPEEFWFHIGNGADVVAQAGDTLSLKTLDSTQPIDFNAFVTPFDEPVPVKTRLLRANLTSSETGWEVVAEERTNLFSYPVSTPGVYRIEVLITPCHLKQKLNSLSTYMKEYPWIQSNPIYITP